MSIAKFSVKNSVLVNMITIMVVIVGMFTVYEIPKEEMPPVEFGMFWVMVMYPGVSPAEMENLVINKIEEEIADVDGIDFIDSSAQEGKAQLMVRFEPGVDIDKAWNDFNNEMDKVRDLPEDAEDPWIMRLKMREVNEICDIALGGEFSGNGIREIAEDLKDKILNVDNVSKVEIWGSRDREVWVEGKKDKLAAYGLTLSDIGNTIRARNMNVPAGTVKLGNVEFLVRTMGEFDTTEEIENLVIRMDENGRSLKVKDVATVKDTLEKNLLMSKLNGNDAVNVMVYKKAEGNIIKVMEDVRKAVADFKEATPGLSAEVRNDGSIDVKQSVSALSSSAVLGIILVFLTLLIFIGWRNAFLAAIGIPFSFLLTIFIMDQLGVTLNNLTLFGLVLVLGMIVDDAIVVLENIHRHMEDGYDKVTAAIKGTQEVMWPVIAAVSTTVAAFMPLLMMEGMMGKFLGVFPVVVSIALGASLFECLIILPSHVSEMAKVKKNNGKRSHGFYRALVKNYRKAIKWVLGHRGLVTFSVIIALVLSGSAVAFKLIKFEFFPRNEGSTITLNLQTPIGTKIEKTENIVAEVEKHIQNFEYSKDIEALVTMVGHFSEGNRWVTATSNAQINIDLIDREERNFTNKEIKEKLRPYLDNLSGLYSYKFVINQHGPPMGEDIELRVKGDNLDRLAYIGEIIKDELAKIPGVVEIEDSFKEGKNELKIIPKPEKLAYYGLTVSDVALTIRTASYGSTVSKYRGAGTDEYDIIVKQKEVDIDDLEDIRNLRIRTRQGNIIYLKDIAEFKQEKSLEEIKHRDEKRIITITASNGEYEENGKTKERKTNEVTDILIGNKLTGKKGVFSDFGARFPGYELEFGGVAEQQSKSYGSLMMAFLVAILIIYTILATQFKSYMQPLVVMLTIPFAFIGVIIGLILTGYPFSITSMISVVALSGVVVNDSLVLVDFVNREREKGVDRWNSLINAGAVRLRPIILTTITTIIGVLPMIFSQSEAARDWKSMAVSIAFGLGFATLLTLFVIPVAYSFIDSITGKRGRFKHKKHCRLSYDDALQWSDMYEKAFEDGDEDYALETVKKAMEHKKDC